MNIRYFFIHDCVINKQVTIEHCSSDDMVADYLTKPLQGKQFYKFRDQIMNIGPNSKYHSTHRSVLNNEELIINSCNDNMNDDEHINDVVKNDVAESNVARNDVAEMTTFSFGIESSKSYKDVLLRGMEKG